MLTNRRRIVTALTAAGIIPFAGLALLSWFQTHIPYTSIAIDFLVLSYAAVIISFIAGTHWGVALLTEDTGSLLIWSNIITLAAWAGLSLPIVILSVQTMIICLCLLLWLDFKLYKAGLHPKWYITLRGTITLGVIICLLAFALPHF
jgi:Protein of unknown function (DUF3429)